ncbi:hypothetical protein BCR43DRAFT_487603 [Syncephalastrum racemosum]|uniref:C2H2-type domain-containing protein n=1 Tax=Syncephalastrum racemosum TaxID=13706 RepID=A0A1X2HHH1_SYNRA|nr:hypothetical protein BCR43DRAFT_487603 [Syncephalastrum racemosum]
MSCSPVFNQHGFPDSEVPPSCVSDIMPNNSFWPYLPNGTPAVDTSTLSEGASSMGIRTPDFLPTTPEHQTRAYYDYNQHNNTTSIVNNPRNGYDPALLPMVNSSISATPAYISPAITPKDDWATMTAEQHHYTYAYPQQHPQAAQEHILIPSPSIVPSQPMLYTPSRSQNMVFENLSRSELIDRVVQLERERYTPPGTTANPAAEMTTAAIPTALTTAPFSYPVNSPSDEIHGSPLLMTGLEQEDEYQDDVKQVHICRWADCDLQTSSLSSLIEHIGRDHIGSGKPSYLCEWAECPRANKPFLKRHKMHNHMRTHTGERPFVCSVPDCLKRFSRLDSLNTHIKTHSNVRPFACTIPGCDKAYFHSRSLRKHIKSHQQPRPKQRRGRRRHQAQQQQELLSPQPMAVAPDGDKAPTQPAEISQQQQEEQQQPCFYYY